MKLYGPYECSDGRKRVVIVKDGRPIVQTFARYIYETIHGPIPPGYEVDHKDEDKSNDEYTNLQLITKAENIRKSLEHRQTKLFYSFVCVCGNKATKELRNVLSNWKNGKKGPFCSRVCAGRFSRV